MHIRLFIAFCLSLPVFLAAPADAPAQDNGKIPLIRDAEIENTIRYYSTPLFAAAFGETGPGMISRVRIHLVLDDRLNAFVAGGERIFIHTGLLRNAESANEVIGVIAHEAGHISGGHLARMQDNMRNASAVSIIGLVLGTAAAVASGRPEAAVAGASIGQSAGVRSFLMYTREMESAADQAALGFLEKSGQSARGLLTLLEKLRDQEALRAGEFDPYLRTHPLGRDRIATVRDHVANSRFSDTPVDSNMAIWHRRMRGKLNGYIDPERSLRTYSADDPDIEARYARLQAYARLHQTDNALRIADALVGESPNDPFFHEIRGEVLWRAGRVRDSLPPYRRAVELYPYSALIRLGLARALLELEDRASASEALEQLKQAILIEPWIPSAWRLQATASGRLQDMGGVAYSLAEEAMLLGRRAEADRHSKRALSLLPANSARWNRTLDIRNRLKELPPPKE